MFKAKLGVHLLVIAVLIFALLSSCSSFKNDKQHMVLDVAKAVSITADVVAIDYNTRHITLKGPRGNVATFYVDESAYNFNNIEVGDQVDIAYQKSAVVSLEKASGEPSINVRGDAARAPKGQKPEAAAYNIIEIRAKVEDIDYKNRTVDLKGPYGNIITIEADEQVQNFDKIKKGDDVIAEYTEAVAISVHPAQKKE